MKITMKGLAEELGISRTTVSLILKGEADRYRISRDTQQRVLRKVEQLKYRPNYFAKALTMRRTGVIGIVFPNVFESFMSEVVKGIEDILYPADCTMMLSTSRFDRRQEQRVLEQFGYRGVDGLLLMFNAPFSGTRYDYDHIRALVDDGLPVVFIDRYLDDMAYPSVVQDDFGGAHRATMALAASGCRRIGCITFDIDVSSIRDRRAGYLAALEERGLRPATQIRLRKRDPNATDLQKAVAEMFGSRGRPDGLFVTTNGIAHKTLHLVKQLGLQLNTDLHMATFGTDPDFNPSGMILVSQPHSEMGRAAATTLLKHIDKPGTKPRRQVLKGTLRLPGHADQVRQTEE